MPNNMLIVLMSFLSLASTYGYLFGKVSTMERQLSAIKTCIQNLSELNFIEKEFVLYSNWNQNITADIYVGSTYVTQVYNLENKYYSLSLHTFKRYTAYVLVTTPTKFSAHLDVLVSMVRWNARAKFIILLEGNAQLDIWSRLAKSFVVNVVVLQTWDLQLFTYDPYKYENLRDPYLERIFLGLCHDFDTLTGSLRRSRVPKFWKNTTIIVGHVAVRPYVIDVTKGTGLEVELVSTLMADYMKYQVSFSSREFRDWGTYCRKNGSYFGSFETIHSNEVDFGIGHFHLREPERIIDFDTTFSYMDDDIDWVVPNAPFPLHWTNMVYIFDKNTWALTTISIILSCVAWQFFNSWSPGVLPSEYRYYRTFWHSLEVPILMVLGLPIMYTPRKSSIRFLFMVFALSYFILVAAWKSYIYISLTYNTSKHQIQNLKEIIEKGYTFALYQELIDLLCADHTPEGAYVCERADRNLCDASHRCMIRVAFQRDACTIATKRILRYFSPQMFRTSTGQEMLYLFKQPIAKDYTVQYYTRGHPMFERSSDLLMWIRTSGFSDNLEKRLDHTMELAVQKSMIGNSKYQMDALGWHNVEGIFQLLMIGLLASMGTFILELIFYKRSQRNRRGN